MKCDLCLAAVTEDKEDALQCEGTCQLWFHRYCVGVCLRVSLGPWPAITNLLSVFTAPVSELWAEVADLRAEVAELRTALDAICSSSDNCNAIASLIEEDQQLKAQPPRKKEADIAQPWSQVVRKGKGKGDGREREVY